MNFISILDYNPIKSLSLSGIGELDLNDLIVIVGPNSSGKTQLLYDVQHAILGVQRDLVVCNSVKYNNIDNLERFIEIIISEGYGKIVHENGKDKLILTAPHYGYAAGSGGAVWRNTIQNMYNKHSRQLEHNNSIPSNDFFKTFGKILSTILYIRNRTSLVNDTGTFDYESKTPENDLQALYINKEAKEKLTEEIKRTFGLSLWLDHSRHSTFCLRVADQSDIPPAEERIEPSLMTKYRTIESEGDGFKSYVGICIAILLGQRPICLIDEPEMCLHPPQAYALGKFIGKQSKSLPNTTILATHSSEILRGIIEENKQAKIIRLTRYQSEFFGSLLKPEIINETLKKPITRAETILDGIFADSVVIVESEGDRVVYEATWEKITEEFSHDIKFIPVGGTGGFSDIYAFYKRLNIPTVIISDLDFIVDIDKLKPLLTHMSTEEPSILNLCKEVRGEIIKLPPVITEESFRDELNSITKGEISWSKSHDIELRGKLRALSNKIYRMGRVKKGLESFEECDEITKKLDEIIDKCNTYGLIFVPKGELENWEPELMKDGPSKKRKSEWSNEAALRIRESTDINGDIFNFMRLVAKNVEAQIEDKAQKTSDGQ